MDKDDVLKDKELWITETGWAKDPNKWWANQVNMEKYYTHVINFPEGNGIVPRDPGVDPSATKLKLPEWIFYFTFRDTPPQNFGLIN